MSTPHPSKLPLELFPVDTFAPDRYCVKTREQLVVVHDYCVDERITTIFKIAYDFSQLADIIEFEQLLKSITPGYYSKYEIQITFAPTCCYKINLQRLNNLFANMKYKITSLTIDNESGTTKVMGKLDPSNFKNLEKLNLNMASFEGSLVKCRKLKWFTYKPADKNEVFQLRQLPRSLKGLALAHLSQLVWPQEMDLWDHYPSLEEIALQYKPSSRQSKLPEGVANVIKYMTCHDTSVFNFEANDRDDGYSKEVWKLLADAAQKKKFALSSLQAQYLVTSPIETYPLKNLDIVAIADPQVLTSLTFPPSLESLRIAWIVECATTELFRALPRGIKSLNLHSCLFSDSIELLKLDDNFVGSVENVHFPKKLKFLSISKNGIEKLCYPDFPISLKELTISMNRIKELDISKNKNGELLNIEVLYFKGNKCKVNDLSWSRFPQSLIGLTLEDYKFRHPSYHFGSKLQYLRIMETDLIMLKSLSFGNFTTIKYLYLPQCNMRKLDIEIPQTVVELDLSANKIPNFPTELSKLRNLQVLDMSFNDISKLQVEFEYNTIEVLNLRNNDIADIELSFATPVTKLKSLDLSHNLLKHLSMKAIGQTEETRHANLYEIVLSGNDVTSKDNIGPLIDDLPESCQCLWVDTYKDSENTEISTFNHYASNEYPNRLVQNKDVSTSRKIFGKDIRMGILPEKKDKKPVDVPPVFFTNQDLRF
ncbi:hypothetical protein KGF57_001813 [Candida theae]|uniref:Uncharacterized protein n=1 Tax=Candida theae TaxID=1198502 RepID=A0AAD5BGH8_9ASCO|nr:uncharacterized protein KGF57_001813 [Candida theae]KAI5960881.1 hypothetical protein KGF57_001813 [Candida theae]